MLAKREDPLSETDAAPGLRTRLKELIPATEWLGSYNSSLLRPDVIAGLSTWAIVVPQAIAYGQIAGMPPQAGLFTAFAGGIAYALFGTSRQLVVSPMSGPAAVSAAIIAPLALGNLARFEDLTALLAIATGIAFLLLGWMKAGFVSQFIAPSVQAGFMFGLGLSIMTGQVPKILGVDGTDGSFLQQWRYLIPRIDDLHWLTFVVGISGIVAMLGFRRLMPAVPAALVVVLASIVLSALFNFSDHGVAIVGSISRSVPLPGLPTHIQLSDIGTILVGALALALIGYTETNTVSEEFAEVHQYDLHPDQELTALGVANIGSGVFGGFITGGGASQSAANDRAGAKTQLALLIMAIMCGLTSAFLMPIFKDLPLAILAAIVITAVTGFINVPALAHIRALRTDSFVISMVALLGVLIFGILPGLLIAVVLSLLLLLGVISRTEVPELGVIPESQIFVRLDKFPQAEAVPGKMIFRVDAPILFLNATWIRSAIRDQIAAASAQPSVVILDMQMSPTLDIKGIDTIGRLHEDLVHQGISLQLANVTRSIFNMLDRGKLVEAIGRDDIFATLDEAISGKRMSLA